MTVMKIHKTTNIIKVGPEDTLSQAFSLLSSTHDSAFVVDGSNFLGVVNPYYSLIKKSYPFNTKAKNCITHPPIIDINYPLKKVAQVMTESKIHYLPVFSNGQFCAIITARRILKSIKDIEELDIKISEVLRKKRPIITVYEDDMLAKAISIFKKNKISKLIVISKEFKLKGILAYFDIISHLITPKERVNYGINEKGKNFITKKSVKNFYKPQVYTIGLDDRLAKAAQIILDKKVGSVIVVDQDKHPVGIITTKDILNQFIGKKNFIKVELVAKNLSKSSMELTKRFISQIKGKLGKLKDVIKAKVLVREKQGNGVYKTVLAVFKKNNQIKIIKEEGKNLDKILKEVKDKT